MPFQRWLRAKICRLVPIAAMLALLSGGLVTIGVATATPAFANTITNGQLGYPWYDATCATPDPNTGKCDAIAYDNWGYNPCPSNDTNCMSKVLNRYGVYDPWNYFLRNCTSFVAWKLWSLGVNPKYFEGLGNGGSWYTKAQSKGLVSVGTTPQVGAAAVAPGSDHVAFVQAWNGTNLTVQEYNADEAGDGDTQTGTPASMGFTEYVYFRPFEHLYETTFQAAGSGQLYLYGDDGTGGNPYTVASGTRPAITSFGNGSYQVAFRNSSDGNLYVAGDAGSIDTGLGIASGTSPSITTLSKGGYEVAFQAAGTGQLYLYGNAGTGPTKYSVSPGTSPAITALSNGRYEVAFRNTSDGNLYMAGVDTGDTGYGIAPGTSPSTTTLSNGGYEVTFQAAGSGQLWVYGDAGTGPNPYTVASGTSPAITSYGNNSYEVAFRNASDGNLYVAGGAGNMNTGLGIAPGTSPGIAPVAGGYEVAFRAAGSNVLYLSGDADHGPTAYGIAAGTSPSIE